MRALNRDLYKYIKIIYCFRSFSVKIATNFTNSIFTPQSFYPIERTKANSNVARRVQSSRSISRSRWNAIGGDGRVRGVEGVE